MKIYKGGTVVIDYQRDGTVHTYRERWYHKIRNGFCAMLCWLGLWD